MPSYKNYGTEGDQATTLVPGTLRVFRHFLADLRTGVLRPMNYEPNQETFLSREIHRYTPGESVHTAKCCPSNPAVRINRLIQGVRGREHGPTPALDCSCGFYASYDPATDFYPGARWGKAYSLLSETEWMGDYCIVRAVCDVSGRVVMGDLGVRAAKMEIKALAIDWGKRISAEEAWPPRSGASWIDAIYDDNVERLLQQRYDEVAESRADIEAVAHRLARRYGVAFWGSAARMYEAHPKADIEAIRPAKAEPEGLAKVKAVDNSWANLFQAINQAGTAMAATRRTYDAQARQFMTTLQGATIAVEILDEIWRADEEPPMTQFERVMLSKKNRPAPPGTGIDRRRGKLR